MLSLKVSGKNPSLLLSSSAATATAAAKSLQSCPTLCDPIDGSPPGFPVPGILQARTLEWVAISFSIVWKWKVKVKSLSRIRLFEAPWTAPTRLLHPWDFPGKSTGVACHCLHLLVVAKNPWHSLASGYIPLVSASCDCFPSVCLCFLMRTPVTGLGPTLIQPNPILTNYIRKDRFNKYDHILRFWVEWILKEHYLIQYSKDGQGEWKWMRVRQRQEPDSQGIHNK